MKDNLKKIKRNKMENLNDDIFNLQPEDFSTQKTKKTLELYQPNPDKGKEGVYASLIRFLPYHKDTKMSKIQKTYVWIQDDTTGESFSVDCPSTVGQKSILKDTYWKLKNSQSVMEQELAQKISRAQNFYSLVQIVQDKNDPELEGKIMVFKFGTKINQKIEAQLKPLSEYAQPCNPYDLFEGKLFNLHVVKKQKWPNYDSSEFIGEKCPLVIDGKPIQKTAEDRTRVLNWLKDNSPELEKYKYKEWTEETHEKVMRAIRNIVPDARFVEQIASTPTTKSKQSGGFVASKPSASQAIDDVVNLDESRTAHDEPAAATTSVKPDSVNSLDDLYAGL